MTYSRTSPRNSGTLSWMRGFVTSCAPWRAPAVLVTSDPIRPQKNPRRRGRPKGKGEQMSSQLTDKELAPIAAV